MENGRELDIRCARPQAASRARGAAKRLALTALLFYGFDCVELFSRL